MIRWSSASGTPCSAAAVVIIAVSWADGPAAFTASDGPVTSPITIATNPMLRPIHPILAETVPFFEGCYGLCREKGNILANRGLSALRTSAPTVIFARCGGSGAACTLPAPQRVGRAFAELASIVAGEFAGMGEAAGLGNAGRGVVGCGEAQPLKGVLEPAFLEKVLRSRVEMAAEPGLQMA